MNGVYTYNYLYYSSAHKYFNLIPTLKELNLLKILIRFFIRYVLLFSSHFSRVETNYCTFNASTP